MKVDCQACFEPADADATRICEACGASAHEDCWTRSGGCSRLTCPAASGYRACVISYLERQWTADMAVVAWLPIFLAGLLQSLPDTLAMGPAMALLFTGIAALSLLPMAAVWWNLRRLRKAAVPLRVFLELARVRHRRTRSLLYRHRSRVARFETWVTNPLLFLVLIGALIRSAIRGSIAGLGASLLFLFAASKLYLGPSRRALRNPLPLTASWSHELDRLLTESSNAASLSVSTRDGELSE